MRGGEMCASAFLASTRLSLASGHSITTLANPCVETVVHVPCAAPFSAYPQAHVLDLNVRKVRVFDWPPPSCTSTHPAPFRNNSSVRQNVSNRRKCRIRYTKPVLPTLPPSIFTSTIPRLPATPILHSSIFVFPSPAVTRRSGML
ncbi:hypothetical protein SCHPADRAFT_911372 [Schizopora paradoxa]|uniref:Secreted protein n=1 Tax=Schizopora paradoxa TaxID=27342 RepID=A0A0H2RJI2_9AGAM|nr:hypothetical protein SCHPADRAFT_911372 [Schizopora paradoxa]